VTDSERRRRVDDLCDAALNRDPRERGGFVAAACGSDEALRRDVEALLKRAQSAEGFLAAPLGAVAAEVLEGERRASLVGRQVGAYQVVSHLGTGGMGEVYRARDTTLGRDVAIKVVPQAFASDHERRARFEREARMLAALNHPHIGAIYGLEDDDGVRALVLELVEGETLAEKLAKTAASSGVSFSSRPPLGLPIGEALKIAHQIADALEAAHEKGIVHRDLKPANVKITPEGTVKVLDFGLAKAAAGDASTPDLSPSPTLTVGTRDGIILGTAAYMSPEQARGKPVDKRADIWAFGCVLYEMLTGQTAFAGETLTDTLGAILEREPQWASLPHATPAGIRRLLQRCVEKDPKRRLHDIADARIEVEDAIVALATDTHLASSALGDAKAAVVHLRPRRRERLAWMFVAAFFVALVSAFGAMRYFSRTPADTQTMRFFVSPPDGWSLSTTSRFGSPAPLAVSPDGHHLAFVATSAAGSDQLWVRSFDTLAAHVLTGTEGASSPFWSPDSRFLGFFADGKLKKIDVSGRPPVTVCDALENRGGTWGRDGVIVFAPSYASALQKVSAAGGVPVAATTLAPGEIAHYRPTFLPDGRHFLYSVGSGRPVVYTVYIASLDSTDRTLLLKASDTTNVRYAQGHLLFLRGTTLVAQAFDAQRLVLTGEEVPMAEQIRSLPDFGYFSASERGVLAYQTGTASRRQLTWFDRSGRALGTMGAPDESGLSVVRLSPDARRVAAFRSMRRNIDIWLLDGARASRFTFDPAPDVFPIWSSDGERIAFDSNRKGKRDLYLKQSSGAGNEELLLESPQDKVAQDFSADGRFLLYQSVDPETQQDLWVLPLGGDRKPWAFLRTRFQERAGRFSPDGRWVAYMSDESGRLEVYVRPFGGSAAKNSTGNPTGGRWQVSTTGGIYPEWRADSKELYYIGPDSQMMAVAIGARGAMLQPAAPVALFYTRIVGGGGDKAQGRQYDVARDGRFLINTVLDEPLSPITVVLDWQPTPAR
jgi:eukaryotic-like serine/threonine-protein kinase